MINTILSKMPLTVTHRDHAFQNYHIHCESSHVILSSELLSIERRMALIHAYD